MRFFSFLTLLLPLTAAILLPSFPVFAEETAPQQQSVLPPIRISDIAGYCDLPRDQVGDRIFETNARMMQRSGNTLLALLVTCADSDKIAHREIPDMNSYALITTLAPALAAQVPATRAFVKENIRQTVPLFTSPAMSDMGNQMAENAMRDEGLTPPQNTITDVSLSVLDEDEIGIYTIMTRTAEREGGEHLTTTNISGYSAFAGQHITVRFYTAPTTDQTATELHRLVKAYLAKLDEMNGP